MNRSNACLPVVPRVLFTAIRPIDTRAPVSTLAALCVLLVACGEIGPGPAGGTPVVGDDALAGDATSVAPAPTVPTAALASAPVGTWYLDIDNTRRTLTLGISADGAALQGTLATEDVPAVSAALESISYDPYQHALRFVVPDGLVAQRTEFQTVVYGSVLVGRAAGAESVIEPPPGAYTQHVHGWNATAIDTDIAPRAFDLHWTDGRHGLLHIDRAAPGSSDFVGTLKVYATDANGWSGEQNQYDLDAIHWDGTALSFTLDDGTTSWSYAASVSGRSITGEDHAGATSESWTGARAEVLSHGLVPAGGAALTAWQARTTEALRGLLMSGAPQPIATQVTALRSNLAPFPLTVVPDERDDDMSLPQAYTLTELSFEFTLANPSGGAPFVRAGHGYLARPTTPAPPGGYPIALALNGHYGSAHQVMDPNSEYWYGDSYARQGYVVIAIDVSHRPPGQRSPNYVEEPTGDDPGNGNGPHPAIVFDGLDSDWAEDGERAWDAMRALDYVLQQPGVNPQRVSSIGFSLGAEVSTVVTALDPRIRDAAISGFSPDLNVLQNANHHQCWQLAQNDLREYYDQSDLLALVAPRGLVVETGQADFSFSVRAEPFAGDKQVMRRGRAAYDALGRARALVHYLHVGHHAYHVGAPVGSSTLLYGISAPVLTAPTPTDAVDWQTSAVTRQERSTVFDFVAHFATPGTVGP